MNLLKQSLSILLVSSALCSCASYHAAPLTNLNPTFIQEYPQCEGVAIGCKQFSVSDCAIYLDRNVINSGYQPIQLTFYNKSNKSYLFTADHCTLPCASAATVADKIHTSTLTRVCSYGFGALLFTPLIIPAVVDGIMSSNANTKLDHDIEAKSKSRLVIAPQSFRTTILFIPIQDFQPSFALTLIEEDTGTAKTVAISLP